MDVRGAFRVKVGGRSPVDKGNAEAILAEASGESSADHAGTNYDNIKDLSHIGFLSDALSLRDDGSQTRDRDQAGMKTLNSLPYLTPAARQRRQACDGS